ncbi:MAG: antiterminator LoaP [bacterium]|nr:antiterminator LoaP [bacterium]
MIQTFVNKEKETVRKIEKLQIERLGTLLPLRKLCIKRKGQFYWELKPLFPGYLFINKELEALDIKKIIRLNHVIKILRNVKNPAMVPEKDMHLILSMMDENTQIPESSVFFLDDRVKIAAGPLKNLEGLITAVDKRKKRITVRLPFFNTHKNVQFSYELVDKIKE